MEIEIELIDKKMFREFTLGGDLSLSKLREKREVMVTATHHTKTYLYTDMQFGNTVVGINFEVEGFKTAMKREHSYFTGTYQIKNYFVKSKKQDKDVYIEYVKRVVEMALNDYMKADLDSVKVLLDINDF